MRLTQPNTYPSTKTNTYTYLLKPFGGIEGIDPVLGHYKAVPGNERLLTECGSQPHPLHPEPDTDLTP